MSSNMKTQTTSIVILLVLGLGVAACQDKLHTGVESLSDAGQGGTTGDLATSADAGGMAGGGAGTGGSTGTGTGGAPTGGIVTGGVIGGGGAGGSSTGGIGSGGIVGGGGGVVDAGSAGSMCNGFPLPANPSGYPICVPVTTMVVCLTCEGRQHPECAGVCVSSACWDCGSSGWGLSVVDCAMNCSASDAGRDGAGGTGGVPTGGLGTGGSVVGGGAGGVPVPTGGLGTGGSVGGGGTGGLASGRVPDNHRPSDAQCMQTAPAGNCPCTAGCSSPQFTCTSDSACADAGANGRCINQGGPAGCGCTYDRCAGDTDCPSGQTCGCHGSPYTFGGGSTCVPGNCRVDADCGTGGYCSPSPAMPCNMTGWDYCQGLGYYCHTPTDWCMNDSDCGVGAGSGCVYSASNGDWECVRYAFPL